MPELQNIFPTPFTLGPMKISVSLILLLTSIIVQSQTNPNNGVVAIDPKGHSANIKMLRFTDDGKMIITASDDKTARVWDVKTGSLINTLRGEIDSGNGGMLNSGAIWPGKPIVVVGGFLTVNGTSQKIKFFNYEDGEQIGYATGPSGSIVAMDFSSDAKFLAGGSVKGELAIWDTEEFKPISLTGHREGVYGVAFSPDGKHMVSGSYDSTVIYWDVQFLTDNSKKVDGKRIKDHTAKVRTVAFSPKGDFFATSGEDNRVLLYNSNGDFVKELIKILDPERGEQYGLGDVHSLAFSDDGKKIAIGTGISNFENVWVVDVATGKKITSFFGHNNSVMALDFFGSDLIASAGGDNRDIFVWNANTGKIVTAVKGMGRRVSAVGISEDNKIAFSQKMNQPWERTINSFGSIDRVFDMENLSFSKMDDPGAFNTVVTEHDGKFLRLKSVQQIVIYGSDGSILKQLDFDAGRDGGVRCYTFTPDGRIAVGTNYKIILFDNDGNRLRELNGHNGEVYSLAAAGNKLVSGSADQTIMLWDLNDEGKFTQTKEEFKQSLIDRGISEERIDSFLKQNNMTFDDLYDGSVFKEVKPILTIFPAYDEWIIFNRDNYYATSKNGSKYVGFHINNGLDKAATFYSFRQFDYQLNRPDVVLQSLGSTNKNLISAMKMAHEKRIKRSGYVVPDNNQLKDAPKLTARNIPEIVKDQKFKLRFTLAGENIKRVNATVNSVPVNVAGGDSINLFKPGVQMIVVHDMNFELLPGKNTIEIWATDINGVSSDVRTFTVVYEQTEVPKPDLFLITLGASQYAQSTFNLTYASKDAQDIAKQFQTTSTLYGKINQLNLTDTQVTTSALIEIKKFLSTTTIKDRVVFFYAGHGVFDKDFNYFLATNDMDFTNPASKGISYESIQLLLAETKARQKLVLIDACHSGEIDKEEVQATATTKVTPASGIKFRNVGQSVSLKQNLGMQSSFALMKDMFADLNDRTGANVISSAGGLEVAQEGGQWRNGLFTYVLLSGWQSKSADNDKDGQVSVSELNRYLREQVSLLSQGKQVPTTRTENIEGDFRIW